MVKWFWASRVTVYPSSRSSLAFRFSRSVVADLPPGQVADPFGPGPAVGIELGPEPVGPFAALVSRDELVQPGHPDIGSVLAEHRHIEPPLASLVLVSRNALDRRLTAGNPGRQWATVSEFSGRLLVVVVA